MQLKYYVQFVLGTWQFLLYEVLVNKLPLYMRPLSTFRYKVNLLRIVFPLINALGVCNLEGRYLLETLKKQTSKTSPKHLKTFLGVFMVSGGYYQSLRRKSQGHLLGKTLLVHCYHDNCQNMFIHFWRSHIHTRLNTQTKHVHLRNKFTLYL